MTSTTLHAPRSRRSVSSPRRGLSSSPQRRRESARQSASDSLLRGNTTGASPNASFRRIAALSKPDATETTSATEKINFIFHEDFEDEALAEQLTASLHIRIDPESVAPAGSPAFIADIYRYPLLSAEEERHLFRQMNYLKNRAAKIQQNASSETESDADRQEIRAWLALAADTRNLIVQCNQRLVISVAKKFVRPTMRLEEVASEANTSLLRAIECFDVGRGYRFSTYASHSMYRHLMRFIRKHDREQSKRNPLAGAPASRHTTEPDRDSKDEEVIALPQILKHLTADEQQIVDLRFGLRRAQRPHTFREIGEIRGVSGERIRQILREALCRVRQAFEHSGHSSRSTRILA